MLPADLLGSFLVLFLGLMPAHSVTLLTIASLLALFDSASIVISAVLDTSFLTASNILLVAVLIFSLLLLPLLRTLLFLSPALGIFLLLFFLPLQVILLGSLILGVAIT